MMPGWVNILIVVLLAVLLFGRGKISALMGDMAKGITAFKKGMKEGEADAKLDDKVDSEKTIDVTASETKTEKSQS